MTNTTSFYYVDSQLTPVNAASFINVDGKYYNGPSNNGVNSTFTVAAATLTIDGVSLVVGYRVLLFGQTNSFENGIYYVYSMDGTNVVLKRANDFQSSEQMKPGLFTTIMDGSAEGGGMATVVSPQAINIGTDAISFVTMNSGSAGQEIYSNTGLKVYDLADTTYYLTWKPGSNFSQNRVFNIIVNDANRSLTLENDITLDQSLATTSSVTFNAVTADLVNVDNEGLNISDIGPDSYMSFKITENLTANRILNILTSDANKSLTINFDTTVNFFGAVLPATTSRTVALGLLGIHYGITSPVNVGSFSYVFTTPLIDANDVLSVSLLSSTIPASITKSVPDTDTIEVFFDNIPGNNTVIQYLAIASS